MPQSSLPAPKGEKAQGLAERLRTYALGTWSGRILLVALGLVLLGRAGVPWVPSGLAGGVLTLYAAYFAARLFFLVVRRLLWRIRTKLLVSYVFIGLVPVVLLSLFFLIAGLFALGLVASYMVSSQIDRKAQELRTVARDALVDLNLSDPRLPRLLAARLTAEAPEPSRLSYALVRRGHVLASQGDGPKELPAWFHGPGWAGLVKGTPEVLRAVWSEGDAFLVLSLPVDEEVFTDLEDRTGIRVLNPALLEEGEGIRIDPERRATAKRPDQAVGVVFLAVADRFDWDKGQGGDLEPLPIRFQPSMLVRRLSPGSLDMGSFFVRLLAAVGVLFLVLDGFALLLGLALARSITGSIHALSRGTERLRHGDFGHPIRVRGRDQLAELAESFNRMAGDIQDLLRGQAEKQRLEEELRIARHIQMSLLPQGTVSHPGLRIAALCLPAAEVGGDYYDLLPLSPTRLGVLVADVSGKGTSAALYMAELKGLVLSLSRIYESPAKLLREANGILTSNMDSRSFITMTYAVVDTATRTMRYARAGHNPIIHFEASTGRTCVLTPAGLGLGIDRGERFDEILEEAEVALRGGDVFLFFTDGLSEAMNGQSELFGERRLRDIVEQGELDGRGEDSLRDEILAEIRRFAGDTAPHDDMTMVVLRVV